MPHQRRQKRTTLSFRKNHWTPLIATGLMIGNFALIFKDTLEHEPLTTQDVVMHLGIFFLGFLIWISNRSDFKDVLNVILSYVPFIGKFGKK